MNGTVATVDAHQHFWDPARADYPWMAADELAPIRRAFGPEDLRPALAERGVERTVLVQTRSSVEETREFLAIADQIDFVAGVVGWVDLADPAVGDVLAGLRSGPGGRRLVGIRHQVHDEPDAEWLARGDVQRGLHAVADAGLAYDLLVRSRELRAALAAVGELADLRFVVDHLAKPPIRDHALEPWATLMSGFAGLPNVWCKVSGMVTEADPARWRVADLRPYVEHVINVFGPERLLFGSDWPVCLLAASYSEVYDAASAALGELGNEDRAAIFGANARLVYRLDEAG
jgi:L-fuconolactonase